MHVHRLVRKVTSKTHVRYSSGSSKLTHSCVVSGVRVISSTADSGSSEAAELGQQLARSQQAFPELLHHHALVGCVVAVVGQRDAEVQHGGVEHAPECFLGSAAPFAREQGWPAPDPLD